MSAGVGREVVSGLTLEAGQGFASRIGRGAEIGDAGWSSPVARQAHNLKVTGSNPVPAPNLAKAPQ